MNYSLGHYTCAACRRKGVFIELAYWTDGTYRCPSCFNVVSDYVDCDNSIINTLDIAETGKIAMIVVDGLYIAGVQRHCLELLDVFKQKGFLTFTVAIEGGGMWYKKFVEASDYLYISTSIKKVSWDNMLIDVGVKILDRVVFCSSHLIIPTVFSIEEIPDSIPLYANLHSEPSEHEIVPPYFFERLLSKAMRVIFPASSTLSAYKKSFALQEEKCFVLNNGLSKGYFAPVAEPIKSRSSKVRIAIVSRIDCDKFSFALFLSVLKLLKYFNNEFKIRIAGNGDSMSELKNIINHLDLNEAVEVLGFVDNPMSLYIWSDVVFLPSKRESMPYVLIESIYMKKPIVLPSIGYMQEHTIDGMFCFEPENAQDAYDKLITAINYNYCDKSDATVKLKTEKWKAEVLEVYQIG